MYDKRCRECEDGVIIRDGQEERPCPTCDGYGSLLTPQGRELIEFLKRRGVRVPTSPLAEDELRRNG